MRRAACHAWEFTEDVRSEVILSDTAKIRMDPRRFVAGLKADGLGAYPLDANLHVKAAPFAPGAVRQWLGFYVVPELPLDETGVSPCSVAYRLNDGTADRYWTGTAWAVAGASDWNTLAQVQAGLPSWPLGTLCPVFHLATTDPRFTPSVRRALVAYRAEVPSFVEDLVLRTLLPALRDAVRPEVDIAYEWTGGTWMILPEQTEEAVVVVGAGSAYHETADPGLTVDVLGSYNPTTRRLDLTKSVTAGDLVLLRAQVSPTTVWLTHPDYDQVASLPVIAVSSVEEIGATRSVGREWLRNVTTGAGVAIRSPRQATWRLGLRLIAARSTELMRLAGEVASFVERSPVLTCQSLDSRADLVMESGAVIAGRADAASVQEAGMQVLIRSASEWLLSEQEGNAVETLFLNCGTGATV